MEKKKSSVQITEVFQKAPEILVIKCRQKTMVSFPTRPLYTDLRKFTKITSTSALPIKLPLDNIIKWFIKRSADIFLSTIVIVGILSWLIPIMALLLGLIQRPHYLITINK